MGLALAFNNCQFPYQYQLLSVAIRQASKKIKSDQLVLRIGGIGF
ncbi:hypothetical protein ABVF61_25165 [Roseibium sp. HPY-6]